MKVRYAAKLSILILVTVCFGCSIATIDPELNTCSPKENISIPTFSFTYSSTSRNKGPERKLLNVSKEILANSKLTEEKNETNNQQHLSISVLQDTRIEAGGFDYLTGLTLGLFPSFRTLEDTFLFNFQLYENDNLINKKRYSTNETILAHLMFLPAGLIQMAKGSYYQEIELYEKALKNFLNDCNK